MYFEKQLTSASGGDLPLWTSSGKPPPEADVSCLSKYLFIKSLLVC
jgi:hypothetical protein